MDHVVCLLHKTTDDVKSNESWSCTGLSTLACSVVIPNATDLGAQITIGRYILQRAASCDFLQVYKYSSNWRQARKVNNNYNCSTPRYRSKEFAKYKRGLPQFEEKMKITLVRLIDNFWHLWQPSLYFTNNANLAHITWSCRVGSTLSTTASEQTNRQIFYVEISLIASANRSAANTIFIIRTIGYKWTRSTGP